MARVTLPSRGEVRTLKRGSLRILREPAETIRSPLYHVITVEPAKRGEISEPALIDLGG